MARKPLSVRISEQEARLAAMKARLSKEERARDTRLKVLLGAFLLYRMKDGVTAEDAAMRVLVTRELPGFLTRESDRALCAGVLGGSVAGPAASGQGGAEGEQQ